ncbi:hypothetical protein [Natranaerofaba carboxydovora]|uniref:hypothetical protein n=1 Tax=Natranaerofaba carboxydovora TaxID=2742683 RepID=UPI001F13E232|nr:hypothetical protein [Natranaerofaba carboxydovora]UMZ73029.1 hypothetical protein ACONDI_00573 [Natranaerofaba carboxydovora]
MRVIRLSEREEFSSDQLVILAKFGEKKHLEELQKGKLFMKNFQFHINKEKEEKNKGLGDKNEATKIFYNPIIQITDPTTKETRNIETQKAEIRLDKHVKKPVFCLTRLDAKDFIIKEINEDYMEAQLSVDKGRKKVLKQFGPYSLLISNNQFVERLKQKLDNFIFKRAIYEDKADNKNFIELFKEDDPDLFFYKDTYFMNQNEKRLVLFGENVEDYKVLDIGDLSDMSYLTETNKLLSGELVVRYPAKEV